MLHFIKATSIPADGKRGASLSAPRRHTETTRGCHVQFQINARRLLVCVWKWTGARRCGAVRAGPVCMHQQLVYPQAVHLPISCQNLPASGHSRAHLHISFPVLDLKRFTLHTFKRRPIKGRRAPRRTLYLCLRKPKLCQVRHR